ncbi:MAG: hypothetical protein KDK54_05075 [Leptospiraceae bacterium]|nr:hypothetical protein [Leptospiraceae bacterium]
MTFPYSKKYYEMMKPLLSRFHRRLFLPIFLPVLLFSFCKEPVSIEGLPKEAVYDRKTNSFTLNEPGKKTVWNKEGKLFSVIELNEIGIEHGLAITYFPGTQSILSEGRYNNGKREGIWIWYFPDGKVYYRSGYSSEKQRPIWIATNALGNEDGIHERYYPNGNPEEKGFYDGGLKTGDWIKYFPNGKLEFRGSYQKDKKIGYWTYFYSDGTPEVEERFSDEGKLIERKTYFPDGRLSCSIKENLEYNCNSIVSNK